ncbi:MAG: hypothetical protein ABIO92_01420 [Chloroflexia bacterium]
MSLEIECPDCPQCGGDMMGYPEPERQAFLVWSCRACGASFVYDEEYNLRPYWLLIPSTEEE